MYHPHADEMVQMAMGMMGLWITHPKEPKRTPGYSEVDRDFCFLLNAFDIEPGSATPKIMTMLDFNLWCWNSRVFPGIDSLPVRLGDRVRIRVGNLTMTNHPIHMHGHEFVVAGTDGGWTNPASRWPEVTADIAVGQMRALEFSATEPGDWAFHCHKSHHTMNAMGHDVPTMIGVDHRDVVHKIQKLVPDYMVMGERGMADMGEMEMPLPDNTLPMMTGQGPMGAAGDGRHVHGDQGARGPGRATTTATRAGTPSEGQRGLRMDRRIDEPAACADIQYRRHRSASSPRRAVARRQTPRRAQDIEDPSQPAADRPGAAADRLGPWRGPRRPSRRRRRSLPSSIPGAARVTRTRPRARCA